MKNKLKLLGIIAVVAVIGFSVTGCDNGNGGDQVRLTVENWWDNPVTRVILVSLDGREIFDETVNIARGTTRTFTHDSDILGGIVTIHAAGITTSGTISASVAMWENRTVLIGANGTITVE